MAHRLVGKPQTISLGPCPEVSLADARLKRDAIERTLTVARPRLHLIRWVSA